MGFLLNVLVPAVSKFLGLFWKKEGAKIEEAAEKLIDGEVEKAEDWAEKKTGIDLDGKPEVDAGK